MATPTWLSGKPLNEWFAISGTTGAGGASVNDYSDFCVKEDTSELFIVLAGGHGSTLDNRVVSIDLSQNSPTWTLRKAASTGTNDAAYYADGTPCSRHTYQSTMWIPERNRIMVFGCLFPYPSGGVFNTVDGFNPTNNTWDAAGTWPDVPTGSSFVRGANSDVWLNSEYRWNQALNTYTSFSWNQNVRWPAAYDSLRNQIFTLQYGDGQGYDQELGLRASKISATGTQTVITFNSSAGLTSWLAEAPSQSAMSYDPIGDKFWFYPGGYPAAYNGSSPSRLYLITPNAGTTWDISLLTLGGGSVTPDVTPSTGTGIMARFKYVPALAGFVMLPQASSTLYFIRSSYGIPTFGLISPNTNTTAPFSLGHSFKKGDIPSGSQLIADISDFQVTPKTTWADGSLRIAIVAGRANLAANVTSTITMSIGTPAGGTDLTTTDLKNTNITAAISATARGNATWATTDWDSPLLTWVSGPKMSSWIYRKQIGSDAHLVGWLEVRLWAGGSVEILPWLENGYWLVASPTNKSDTYEFKINGTQRESITIDLKHNQRTPIISGTELSYYLSADPLVVPLHDVTYLQSTEMVPSYSSSLSVSATAIVNLVSTFTPLAASNITYDTDSMPSSGYQRPIGMLPEHDVLHLVAVPAARAVTYRGVIRNSYAVGRYGIHFRDESTQFPPKFTTYPNYCLYYDGEYGIKDTGQSVANQHTPSPTGGDGPVWDAAHCLSVGYMAYLLTGSFYAKETTQFAAITNHFYTSDYLRGGSNEFTGYNPLAGFTNDAGICNSSIQIRAGAWRFRSLINALAIVPDSGDSLRAEFIMSVSENARYFSQVYVEQANQPYGFIEGQYAEPWSDIGTEHRQDASWQHDFGTGVWGWALALDLPISAGAKTKMANFFEYKAKSIVGRLGTAATYPFEHAAVYVYAISPIMTPNFVNGSGPWYSTALAAYNDTNVMGQSASLIANTLYAIGFGPMEQSFWGNLMPAIAYSCRHGAAGAASAYSRLTGATNFSELSTGFNSSPVWSVKPFSITITAEEETSSSSTLAITRLSFMLRRHF